MAEADLTEACCTVPINRSPALPPVEDDQEAHKKTEANKNDNERSSDTPAGE